MKKKYRITEISGWYRVRDEKNNEYGMGNSPEEALTETITTIKSENERLKIFVDKVAKHHITFTTGCGALKKEAIDILKEIG